MKKLFFNESNEKLVYHARTGHIEVHFCCQQDVDLASVNTGDQRKETKRDKMALF